jgi:hypothetical protein
MEALKHSLTPGNRISQLIVESFYDKSRGRIRIRPVAGQGVPTDLTVSSDLAIRNDYKVGTRFRCYDVIVIKQKNNQATHLRVSKFELYKI